MCGPRFLTKVPDLSQHLQNWKLSVREINSPRVSHPYCRIQAEPTLPPTISLPVCRCFLSEPTEFIVSYLLSKSFQVNLPMDLFPILGRKINMTVAQMLRILANTYRSVSPCSFMSQR